MNKEQLELRIKEELLKDSNRPNAKIAVAILGNDAKHNEVENVRNKVSRLRKKLIKDGLYDEVTYTDSNGTFKKHFQLTTLGNMTKTLIDAIQYGDYNSKAEGIFYSPKTDELAGTTTNMWEAAKLDSIDKLNIKYFGSKTPEEEEFTNSHIEAMKKAGIEVKVRDAWQEEVDERIKYYKSIPGEEDFISSLFKNKYNPDNVLVIPCLHEPFSTKAHLQHCIDVKEKYNCGKVIFLGDIVDNHYSSFHENNPDGYSAIEELELVKEHLKLWKQAFPEAVWILGNHDKIPERKVFSSGLSKQWLKSYNEVLNVNWECRKDYIYNGVYYVHGETMTAKALAGKIGMPVVQAHRHSEYYIQYLSQKIWGMQTGVIFDKSKYAFAYAKESTQTWVEGCAVVEGNKPHLIAM